MIGRYSGMDAAGPRMSDLGMKVMKLKSEVRTWSRVETPLGRLGSAGVLVNTAGTGFERMRTLEVGALVLLVAGGGRYRDENGGDERLGPGDCLCVPPGVGHMYGPEPGEKWTETYVTFDGAAFAGWYSINGDAVPRVRRLGPAEAWLPRWRKIVQTAASSRAEAVRVLADIHVLLHDVTSPAAGSAGAAERMEQTRELVATWPARSTPEWERLARMCHLSYESWRKAFRRAYGEPPARYRRRVLMEQAGELMRRTSLTNEQLAEQFGCADAFHFSKMFKQVHGDAPRRWRAAD